MLWLRGVMGGGARTRRCAPVGVLSLAGAAALAEGGGLLVAQATADGHPSHRSVHNVSVHLNHGYPSPPREPPGLRNLSCVSQDTRRGCAESIKAGSGV